MILELLVPGAEAAPPATAEQGLVQRPAADPDRLCAWIAEQPIERVVVAWPCPGFNPFALARRLRQRSGPPLMLFGRLRPDTRFWAERNGCQVAATRAAAVGGEHPPEIAAGAPGERE